MGNDTGKSGGDRYPFGAQERLHLIYERLAEMTRSEVAAMIVIAEHANSQTGACWPSYGTVSKRAGMSRRAAITAVKKLAERGIIAIESRGEKRPQLLKLIKPASPDEQGNCASPDETELVKYSAASGEVFDTEKTDLVKYASPKPLIEPGLEPGDNKDAEQHPHAGAADAFEPKSRQGEYEWFWNLYPAHSHIKVNEVERMLSSLIEKGITREQIEPGLQRFRAYTDTVGSNMRPLKFLTEHHWRDAWQVFDRKKNPGSKKIEKTITANADGHVADVVARFRSKLNDIKIHITGLTERKTALQRLRREIDEAEDRHIWGPEGEPPKPETARKLAYCEQCFDAWYSEIGTQCSSGASLRSLWDEVDDELAMRG